MGHYIARVDDSLETWFIREILPYEGALMRYLAQRRARAHEIEDLRNDVYIRVLESARKVRPTAPKAFLFVTARNLLVDRIRHERVVPIEQIEDVELADLLIDELSAEQQASGRQRLQQLARMFDRLPQRCREVLWMRRIEGLPQKTVAARLGLADATVEKHLYRALKTLTEAFYGAKHTEAEPSDLTSTTANRLHHGD